MKVKVTIMPSSTQQIEVLSGSTLQDVLNMYATITGVSFTEKHTASVNGRTASLSDTLNDGDRVIATQNKEGNSEMQAEPQVQQTEQETTTEEKVLNAFLTAKTFFSNQLKMYEKNKVRTSLISLGLEKISEMKPTEEALKEAASKVAPSTITRQVKWNASALEHTSPKSYFLSELQDKADELKQGSAQQAGYLLLINKIKEEWQEEIKLFPCFHPRCNSTEYLAIEQAENGFIVKCTNGIHNLMPIATSPKETEDEAKLAWNQMVR